MNIWFAAGAGAAVWLLVWLDRQPRFDEYLLGEVLDIADEDQ